MPEQEEIERWESEGGFAFKDDRVEYARRTVQENQYDVSSQKVRR